MLDVPVPGAAARAFRAGKATSPEHAVGERIWIEWLEDHYETGE